MAPIAGWYDDPRDAQQLRYWDGAAWTDHVTAREQAPTVPQWQYPGAPPAQQQTWQYGAPAQQVWQQAPQVAKTGPLTPDGATVTTWIKRFAARLLDGIFVFIGGLPVTAYFIYRYYQAYLDQTAGATPSLMNITVPTGDALGWEIALLLVSLLLQVVYEVVCLRRWGATPGKMLLGISVRAWERGGQLSWAMIARRVGFMNGLALLTLVPVVSLFAGIAWLLDYLWPLWDSRNQALHDKFAGTAVVEGPRQQPAPAG